MRLRMRHVSFFVVAAAAGVFAQGGLHWRGFSLDQGPYALKMPSLRLAASEEVVGVAEEPAARSSESQNFSTERENPMSRGTGLRVVGFVLMGTGLLDLGLGILLDVNDVFAEMYDEFGMRSTGETIEKLSWIEGVIRAGIAMPLIVAGYVQLSRWEAWEREHGGKQARVRWAGDRIVLAF